MNLLTILENLYTNRRCDWIKDIDDTTYEPYVLQRWLVMNDMLRVQTRWLDKYIFNIPKKMYLSLAWSVIPKTQKMPFNKYIKENSEEEEFMFILERVRKHFKLSDNDYRANRDRLIKVIKKDMVGWFSFYGIPKRYWQQYYLNFNLIKNFREKNDISQKGLDAWGL